MTIPLAPIAVLFDADGVIQHPPPDWQTRLPRLAGIAREQMRFLEEVFAAERPCLTGESDFHAVLGPVLERWNSPCSVEQALSVWLDIDVDHAALAIVDDLRKRRVTCCLTTNQHARRARHMSQTLGYASRFDREFYSCDLGHAKPSPAFFEAVLEALVIPSSRALFIDDNAENVASARALGFQAVLFDPTSGADMLRGLIESFGLHARGPLDHPA